MDRTNVIKLPIDTVWLQDQDAQNVCRAIVTEGGAIFFVGGCVRDALLGLERSDVDLATNITPTDVMRLVELSGLKAVPTGIDHGTVTVVSGGKGYEVTTFRHDVETDGRRAVVAFSDDMTEDARRRDFTFNALYATPQGDVIDPLGTGVADCLDRRVRFIEDATTRIREDYLRILRYFRFFAWYSAPLSGLDPEALDAIADNIDGLQALSRERIGTEILKLLQAPDPVMAVAAMRQTGCLARVLPGGDDSFLGPVVHLARSLDLSPDPLLRLVAMGGENVGVHLRLSRNDARYCQCLKDRSYGAMSLPEIAYRDGVRVAQGAAIIRCAMAEREIDKTELQTISAASKAVFPVAARDLMPSYKGRELGQKLSEIEDRWIASGFSLSRQELLDGV